MNFPAPRLSCRGLALAVPGRTLCTGLDLDVHSGECWAIVGPNGAGKTTLLAALAGLRPPAAGAIAYDGIPLPALVLATRKLGQRPIGELLGANALERAPHLLARCGAEDRQARLKPVGNARDKVPAADAQAWQAARGLRPVADIGIAAGRSTPGCSAATASFERWPGSRMERISTIPW